MIFSSLWQATQQFLYFKIGLKLKLRIEFVIRAMIIQKIQKYNKILDETLECICNRLLTSQTAIKLGQTL